MGVLNGGLSGIKIGAVVSLLQVVLPSITLAQCPPSLIFSEPSFAYLPTNGSTLALDDFNNDGILDLAIGGTNAIVVMTGLSYDGSPTGLFGGAVTLPSATNIATLTTADFNNDGIRDLAILNAIPNNSGNTDSVSLYLGLGNQGVGNGSFTSRLSYPVTQYAQNMAIADLNSDSILDIAIADFGAVIVMLGTGTNGVWTGTFGAGSSYALGGGPGTIALEDFNADGIRDIAVPLQSGGSGSAIAVLLGNGVGGIGDGSFSTPTLFQVPPPPYGIVTGDLNNDSITDLVISAASKVLVLVGKEPNGSAEELFDGPLEFNPHLNPASMAVTDLNGDGIKDLVAAGWRGTGVVPGVSVLLGQGVHLNGAPSFTEPAVYPVEFIPASTSLTATLGDLTGDGLPDIVMAPYSTSSFAVAYNLCGRSEHSRPEVVSIADIPFDQGGQVKVEWSASSYDFPGGPVDEYWLWRSVPSAAARLSVASGSARLSTDKGVNQKGPGRWLLLTALLGQEYYWEFLSSHSAAGLNGYSSVASTVGDSTEAGNPLTAFFVQARSQDGLYEWSSDPDSGYSVDNLSPSQVPNIGGYYSGTGELTIHWSPVGDDDLSHYSIYSGSSPDFVPNFEAQLGQTADTIHTLTEVDQSTFYKVTAVDVHGNESHPAVLAPGQVSGNESGTLPPAAYLQQNYPNPFNPKTSIEFGIRAAGQVAVKIYSADGRLVRTLLNRWMPQGVHVLEWNGKSDQGTDLPSGVYLAGVDSRYFRKTIKMVLSK